MRDVLAGEDAIKKAGERYVAKLDGQETTEYNAYINRGLFYAATARTLSGYLGMIFRKKPAVKVPDNAVFETFLPDVDLSGTSFESYARTVVAETLTIGRCGTLVDWEESEQENRAFFNFYTAENILNWQQTRINGRMQLTLVALFELVEQVFEDDPFTVQFIGQIRVLRLVPLAGVWTYQVDLWQQVNQEGTEKRAWQLIATKFPLRRNVPLSTIPFVFHGPKNALPAVERSPMDDIAVANLDHFRINVDFKHGLHFTALPTAWVAGFDAKTQLRIGSTVAWVTETVGATAGFLEFKGEGLMSFERALDRVERLLTVLGARLLESQKRAAESAEALAIRQAGESSIVADLAHSVSASLTDAFRWLEWWHGSATDVSDISEETVSVELNTDFESNVLPARDLIALVWAWQKGALSRDALHYRFDRGDILPPNRTLEEELALIKANPPPVEPDETKNNPPLIEVQ